MLHLASIWGWKGDKLLGVDVREVPVPVIIDGGDPVAVHANPEPVVHERQNGCVLRTVEGHHVVHRVVQTIFSCLVPVLIDPTSRLRHQQAGFIPTELITFTIADPLVQLPRACGKPDGADNVYFLSDDVDGVTVENLPVTLLAFPAKPPILHHMQMDLGGGRMQVGLGFS